MIKPHQVTLEQMQRHLNLLLEKHEKYVFSGSQDPHEAEFIDSEYKLALAMYRADLKTLFMETSHD